jgi:hypothetical protein
MRIPQSVSSRTHDHRYHLRGVSVPGARNTPPKCYTRAQGAPSPSPGRALDVKKLNLLDDGESLDRLMIQPLVPSNQSTTTAGVTTEEDQNREEFLPHQISEDNVCTWRKIFDFVSAVVWGMWRISYGLVGWLGIWTNNIPLKHVWGRHTGEGIREKNGIPIFCASPLSQTLTSPGDTKVDNSRWENSSHGGRGISRMNSGSNGSSPCKRHNNGSQCVTSLPSVFLQ